MDKYNAIATALAEGWILAESTKTGDGYLVRWEDGRRKYNNEIGSIPSRTIAKLLKSEDVVETDTVQQEERRFYVLEHRPIKQ